MTTGSSEFSKIFGNQQLPKISREMTEQFLSFFVEKMKDNQIEIDPIGTINLKSYEFCIVTAHLEDFKNYFERLFTHLKMIMDRDSPVCFQFGRIRCMYSIMNSDQFVWMITFHMV